MERLAIAADAETIRQAASVESNVVSFPVEVWAGGGIFNLDHRHLYEQGGAWFLDFDLQVRQCVDRDKETLCPECQGTGILVYYPRGTRVEFDWHDVIGKLPGEKAFHRTRAFYGQPIAQAAVKGCKAPGCRVPELEPYDNKRTRKQELRPTMKGYFSEAQGTAPAPEERGYGRSRRRQTMEQVGERYVDTWDDNPF